jgi:uncharacterized membrane protein
METIGDSQSCSNIKDEKMVVAESLKTKWLQGIAFVIMNMCWFSPLPPFKQITNAFALPYIGVNITVFYVNLAIQGGLSIVVAVAINRNEANDRTEHVN